MMKPAPNAAKRLSSLTAYISCITSNEIQGPTGVRIIEPPLDTRQALRGNLYAVAHIDGAHSDTSQFVEHLLTEVQRGYYSLKGGQSQVLTEAVRLAYSTLEPNISPDNYPDIQINFICAALLRDRFLIVSCGSAFALISTDEKVSMFPSDLVAVEKFDSQDPPLEVHHQEMKPGNTIFLGSGAWLDNVPIRTLASTVAYVTVETSAEAAMGLYEQMGDHDIPGMLILLQPGSVDDQPPSTLSAAANSFAKPPSLLDGLPTSVGTSFSPKQTSLTTPAQQMGRDNIPVETHQDSALISNTSDPFQQSPTSPPETSNLSGGYTDDYTNDSQEHSFTLGELRQTLENGLHSVRKLVGNVLPDSTKSIQPDSNSDLNQQIDRTAPFSPQNPEDNLHYIEPIERALPIRENRVSTAPPLFTPQQATGSRTRLFVTLALLIAILVPVIVFAVQQWENADRRAEGEILITQAMAMLASAQDALDLDDMSTSRSLLAQAEQNLLEAAELTGYDDERITTLLTQIEEEQQQVEKKRPLYGLASPLVTFTPDAQPHRVLVIGQDIYVLDTGRQLVQHFQMDPAGQTVPDPQGDVVLRLGDVFDTVAVGRLTDFAWQPIVPGIQDKPNLLVLDRNNNIFWYDPRVDGARLLTFATQDLWQVPNQIQTYPQGRIYIADEGVGQMYRYDAGNYNAPPSLWFTTNSFVDLVGLIALEIDGDIWLLYNNGLLLRYRQGEQADFALETVVGSIKEPVDLFVASGQSSGIYIADAGENRVVVFDKDGIYRHQLVAAEGQPLQGLRGLFIDEVANDIYILTRTALYKHPLP